MLRISILSLLGGYASAFPTFSNYMFRREPDCSLLADGIQEVDCQYMADIGMAGMGDNESGNNGNIWIADDGPNTFTFTNNAEEGDSIILIVWDRPEGDDESSFMNVCPPKVSYSLPEPGDQVTISIENGISGAWSTLTNYSTTLSQYGQIYNTWGEFTTGEYATVDVSRLINMSGTTLSVVTESGCVSDMDRCSFHCKGDANECGESGTYDLVQCSPDDQPDASTGTWDGINPEGGCQGWSDGGHLDISLGK